MIKVSSSCTACGACVQKCPVGCIALKEDECGFVYPFVDEEKCINCNACNRVCHLENDVKNSYFEQKAFAVVHRDQNVLDASTSGGAFTAIAHEILSREGVVYGCAYTDHVKAKHIKVCDVTELKRLNGSKYVQSEIGDAYKLALEDLKNDKWVLFSGTPCHIAGLKAYLGKDYPKLVTVDIICHGVPSQAYFDKFIEWYEHKNKVTVSDFNFRSKKNYGWSEAGICFEKTEKSQKDNVSKIFYFDNYYYHYFLKGAISRESCYQCKYANLSRVGDFTIGDFWGIEGLDIPFNTKKGCSLLILNTQKSSDMLEALNVYVKEVPMKVGVANNAQLHYPCKMHPGRTKLLEEYKTLSADEIQRNYLKSMRVDRIKSKIRYSIPKKLKMFLLGLRYKKSYKNEQ